MNFTGNLIIDIYSIALLIFIGIHAIKHTEHHFLQHKLFMLLVQVIIWMLILDIMSRFDGNPGTIYAAMNQTGNFLIYLFSPIPPSLWLLYAHCQVVHEAKISKWWLYPLFAVNAANAAVLVLSQFFGWLYYIDSNNVYHRGFLFLLPASLTLALTLAAFVLIVANRKSVEKKYYFSLVFFPVLPVICVLLQIAFYGVSLMLNAVALSLLIVFLSIQNSSMNTDYLTGVYNRKKLETYMKEKIGASTESKTFSAILIDLDDFKLINDTYGHDMGDAALEASAKLLKNCLGRAGFVARFGGDEFYAILDESNLEELERTVCRIHNSVGQYNEHSIKPFRLGFSMGYSVYDYHSGMGVDEFQKKIDQLMYENKRANKK